MTDGNTNAPSPTEVFTITNRDVEGLIRVLGQIAEKLTKGEWGLLLSILAAAANDVKVGKDTTNGTFPEVCVEGKVITEPRNQEIEVLLEQLRSARMPAKAPGQSLGSMVTPPKHK
jgi:hypothetical protein